MSEMRKSPKRKLIFSLIFLAITVLFFSFSPILTFDSVHYLGYVEIFEHAAPWSSWDPVRSFGFPLVIFVFTKVFGRNTMGLAIGLFLLYLGFVYVCEKICLVLVKRSEKRRALFRLIMLFAALNPLIFGYFHVALTEALAIPLMMLSIFMGYKFIFAERRKERIIYTLFFVTASVFLYHLKQPYVIISLVPMLISTVIACVRERSKGVVLSRLGSFGCVAIALVLSIVAWGGFIRNVGADQNHIGRDASSMLAKQILFTYQIETDTQKISEKKISAAQAVKLVGQDFLRHPLHVVGTYLGNYCGLTSICEVHSDNGVDYHPTSKLNFLTTFENKIIGYATFSRSENVFGGLGESMAERAASFSVPMSRTVFRFPMKALSFVTDILYKIVMILCLPALVLMLVWVKTRYVPKYKKLIYLNVLLLGSATLHLLISATACLIIDRYAIEAFVPAVMGMCGVIIYYRLSVRSSSRIRAVRT